MHCKNCGHALGSRDAICPNCGALMSNEQLKIRKSINGANNPYIKRLEEINKKNAMYKTEERSDTNNVGYAIFVVLMLITITFIIGFILVRR